MAVNFATSIRLQQVRDKLGRFTKQVKEVPAQVLLEEAPRIEAEAKLETPVDTGALQASVTAQVTRTSKTKVALSVQASAISSRGYDYANIQHENESFNHPNGGKAHYIKDPFERGVERISRRLSKEVKYDP